MADMMGYTLWLMLHDEEFMRTNTIVPAYFPRGSSRFLAELALSHWSKHQELLDDATLDMAVEQDTPALGRNKTDPDAAVDTYVTLTSNYAIKPGSLRNARERCRAWLEQRALELQVARAQRELDRGDTPAARAQLTAMPTVARNAVTGAHISLADPVTIRVGRVPGGVPTGFKHFDDLWDGGAHPGELGMVAGATGTGKSMALCFMTAAAFWAGANVLYYTFELSVEQIKERVTAAIFQRPLNQISGQWEDELMLAAQTQYGLNAPPASDIDIRNEPRNWPEILADIEQYQREWGKYPDVLMLDSADDVAPLKERDAEHAQLKETFVMLRDYAAAKQIRIWTSAQLTRDAVEKGYVNLRHIGSAFAKTQKSHYVLGFAQTEAQRNDVGGPKMMLYILKDSLWGTHGYLELETAFGRGKYGYPGYSVLGTQGLPSPTGGSTYDEDPI